MAEITTTFDTKTKGLTVEMNGKAVKNVTRLEIWNWGDQAGIEIQTVIREDDEDLIKITKIVASENGDDIIEESTGSPTESLDNILSKDLGKLLFPPKR